MDTNAPAPNAAPASPERDNPGKYVRTFAGDMETLKGGGVPDLAPLAKGQPVTSPPTTTSAGNPAPPPPPQNPPHATTSIPAAPGSFMPPASGFPASRMPQPTSTPLQTYAGDFADRMKETHASAATVLAAEQDSAPRAPRAIVKQQSRANIVYIVAAIILLASGTVGAYIAYSRYLAAIVPIVPAPSVSAPIFIDDRQQISGAGPALLLAMQESVARTLASNSVRLLYISTSTPETVFSALPLSVPSIVLRNVNVEGSMAGVVNVGGNQTPFFILSVSSYSNTFAGMLTWEKMMPRVLIKLFPPYPVSTSDSTISSTTATTTQKPGASTPAILQPAPATGFADATIANHDARVYRDAEGREIIVYGYWNQTTLVIARNTAAFTEILQRLATSRAQ